MDSQRAKMGEPVDDVNPSARKVTRIHSTVIANARPRIVIAEEAGRRFLQLGNEEVVAVGGNYVLKAAPWFLPVEDVEADAKLMADNLKQSGWSPEGKRAVPIVRLGALWEGAMPSPGQFDASWIAALRATIETFARHGIYCFIESHQDALCSSNGGEGIPWWVADAFRQQPEHADAAYVVSPSTPLELALPRCLQCLPCLPKIQTAPGDKDPWKPFSVEDGSRDASLMNIGNRSIRMNNYGASWKQGILFLSKQVQNVASRLYRSHSGADRAIFDHYVEFIKLLASVWRDHSTVIAIELWNEPPMGGLWDFFAGRPSRLLRMRSDLWRFQGATLEALDAAGASDVVVCVTDIGQACPAFSAATWTMAKIDPVPTPVKALLRNWATANRLMLSFHYYAPPSTCSFVTACSRATRFAAMLGGDEKGLPTFLSEFVDEKPEQVAAKMRQAVAGGVNAVAYWQFVSLKETRVLHLQGRPVTFYQQRDAWAAYASPVKPPVPDAKGRLPKYAVTDDDEEFDVYQKQVERGEFWGAAITQFGGSEVKHSVLNYM
mmetsp:Transcript_76903/g.152199  ORF Transcript_76903/g.152199 Transcript_76903/m.152199 type:complete len:549 (-) Transcript_76903:91-1737(-)